MFWECGPAVVSEHSAWLALGIAFGIRQTTTALWLGVVLGAELLAWATAHRISRVSAANAEFLVRQPRGLSRRAWQAGSGSLASRRAAPAGCDGRVERRGLQCLAEQWRVSACGA